jgi:uncharacterized protein
MNDLNNSQIELMNLCRKLIDDIDRQYPISFGYIFGSRAKGDYHRQSDLDLALMFQKKYDPSEEVFIRGDIVEMGKKYLPVPVDVVSMANAALFLQFKVVQEGIILIDKKPGERADFESLVRREYFDFQYYSDYYNQRMIEHIKEETYFGEKNG